VQAHPGQHEGAVQGIPVGRLVHVPEHGHVDRSRQCSPAPSVTGAQNPRARLIR
jgi:hypothetical protein